VRAKLGILGGKQCGANALARRGADILGRCRPTILALCEPTMLGTVGVVCTFDSGPLRAAHIGPMQNNWLGHLGANVLC